MILQAPRRARSSADLSLRCRERDREHSGIPATVTSCRGAGGRPARSWRLWVGTVAVAAGAAIVATIAVAACGPPNATAPRNSAVAVASVGTSPGPPEPPSSGPTETSQVAPRAIDLTGVPEASVPIVRSQHLDDVQQLIRAEVGGAVFAGAAFEQSDTPEVTMTIFATDVRSVAVALDEMRPVLRDRIEVVAVEHSIDDLEAFAVEARRRLADLDLVARTGVSSGVDAVVVSIETADGERDARLEAAAIRSLDELPVVIEFGLPPRDL